MDFSIVVPFHNEEEHVEECVQALLTQDYDRDRYEILMVNNNSTDRSTEIVSAHEGIRLYHEQSPGDFAARNLGISKARGRIIAFTDADTAPLPDWLTQASRLMEDPRIVLIVGKLQFSSGSAEMQLMCDYEAEKNRYIFSSEDARIYYGYTCNMIVRSSVFQQLGPFPKVFRNSDVIYVRMVADEFTRDAVRYGESVKVCRLEVTNYLEYLTKQFRYGCDLHRYADLANVRPLNTRERFAVFRKAVRSYGYSPATTAYLLALLTLGAVSYDTGRLIKKCS